MKSSTFILFATLVIVMLGFGIVMPLMPYYIDHFGAGGAALGLMMSLYSLMQFIFAPLWGRVSDQRGRKPVLLVGLSGFALAFVAQGFAQNLGQFIAARVLAGALSAATLPTAMAYIADTTPPEKRSGGMGQMGAAMGLGMIFGPMLGGMLTRFNPALPPWLEALFQHTSDPASDAVINLTVPFLGAALLALVTIPLVIFVLPESLPKTARDTSLSRSQRTQPAASPHKPSFLSSIRNTCTWRKCRCSQFNLRNSLSGSLGILLVLSFLLAFALANLEGVMGLFAKDRFSMGPDQMGLLMGGMGILSVLQQGFMMNPLVRRFGEERVLLGGLVISALGMLGLALAGELWVMIVLVLFFNAGNSLLRPTVTSLISKQARMGQGQAMGLANSFQSLGRAAGPLMAGGLYDVYQTLPFWSGAILQAVALLWALRGLGKAEGKTAKEEEETTRTPGTLTNI